MASVDAVVHCAAALPLYRREDILSTDVEGTRILLDEAFRVGVDRFVFISSTAVYGVPERVPVLETDPLVGVGPYGRAKILAERACDGFRSRGMNVPVLRPKSFIGPERLGVFSLLFDWAADGKGFPVLGSGGNQYQLLDVRDLCEAVVLCLDGAPSTVSDVFNIGAREFSTIRADFQAVLDEAGFRPADREHPRTPGTRRAAGAGGIAPLAGLPVGVRYGGEGIRGLDREGRAAPGVPPPVLEPRCPDRELPLVPRQPGARVGRNTASRTGRSGSRGC